MVGMTQAIDNLMLSDLTTEIRRTMRRSAKDAVQLGYMLRRVLEERLYQETYNDFDTYLADELHMDYTMANRFISINKKYSVMGKSMEISAGYESYSQGLLIEMLNMTPEQEAKVTPDMTVKQAREIKRQSKPQGPVPEPVVTVAIGPEKKEVIIDGEFREIKESESEVEKVATSQPEESSVQEREKEMPEEETVEYYKGIGFVRSILQEHQKLLNDYLAVGGLPEKTVEKQKIIVAALAAMVCDLDLEEAPLQSEFPDLKNDKQRKEAMWDLDENDRPILVLNKEGGKFSLAEVQDYLWHKANGSYRGNYVMIIDSNEEHEANSDQWILYPVELGSSCPICGGQVDYYDK